VKVEILTHNIYPDPMVLHCKEMNPDWKIVEHNTTDFKRLIKKLIKERNILLKMYIVQFRITCPIFVYYQVKELVPSWSTNMTIITSDDLMCESSDILSSIEETNLVGLFRKIKTYIKDMEPEKAKYFLPLSSSVKVSLSLDILQVYSLLSKLVQIEDKKIKELVILLQNCLFENNSLIFNDQLLSVFGVDKEQPCLR